MFLRFLTSSTVRVTYWADAGHIYPVESPRRQGGKRRILIDAGRNGSVG